VTHVPPRHTLEIGVWGVLVTPFAGPTMVVDESSLAGLARHYEAVGATGLTVLGVFGEAARLSAVERLRVLRVVTDVTTLPIVAGVTALATAPAVEEIERIVGEVGDRLAAVMVQANTSKEQTLQTHLRRVHGAGASIVLQDYPEVSGITISPSALGAAAAGEPWIAAVKAESPPTAVAVGMLTAQLPGVPVFGGLGGVALLDELAAGAAGAMTGFSYPEGLIACVNAYMKEGFDHARERLLPYIPLINFEQQPRIGLGIRKEALRRRGLIRDAAVRAPGVGMPSALSDQLDRHLELLEGVKEPRNAMVP
jgi:4-hydroxy-tetrahydrodipicolinate synthase